MSGIYNEKLDFGAPEAQHVAFSAHYEDDRHNLWRIDVAGDSEVVGPFVESRGLTVEAIPLAEEEYSLWRQEHRSEIWDKLRRQLSHATLVAGPGEIDLQQVSAGYADFATERDPRLPAMTVTINLLELVQEGPHRLRFEIDPDVWEGSHHNIYFQLYGGDITPDVSCSTTNGSVRMSLHGGGQAWIAQIRWAAGAPAHYVLSGDVVRN